MSDESTTATPEPVRILSLVHEEHAGSGVFADVARERAVQLTELRVDRSATIDDAGEHDALIVLGGSMHATQDDLYGWIAPEVRLIGEWVGHGRPLLGVCLGAQLLCRATGGVVRPVPDPEVGWWGVELDATGDALLGHLPARVTALQWHSYECLPAPGSTELARSPACLQAFRIGEHAWGVQFHPETARKDLESWIREHALTDEARATAFDAPAALDAMDAHIDRWNEIGRSIAHRFIDHVQAVKEAAAGRSAALT